MTDGDDLGPCPICGRPMVAGPSIDRHHWVPRTKGGRAATPVHLICHRMLHRLYSEKEMARTYNDPAVIRADPRLAPFLRWVGRKPPQFVAWPAPPRRR